MDMLERLRLAQCCSRGMHHMFEVFQSQYNRAQSEYQNEYCSTVLSLQKIVVQFLGEWAIQKRIPFQCSLVGRSGISVHIESGCISVHLSVLARWSELSPVEMESIYFIGLQGDLLNHFCTHGFSVKSVKIIIRKAKAGACSVAQNLLHTSE